MCIVFVRFSVYDIIHFEINLIGFYQAAFLRNQKSQDKN